MKYLFIFIIFYPDSQELYYYSAVAETEEEASKIALKAEYKNLAEAKDLPCNENLEPLSFEAWLETEDFVIEILKIDSNFNINPS